jgi:hypothetical protein
MSINFEKDAKVKVSNEMLAEISALTSRQIMLENEIKNQEVILKELKEELYTLQEIAIPDKFAEYGISEIKLEDGSKVTIKQYYGASISGENRDAAFGWLREHEFDDLIKHQISTSLGKGEDEKAQAITAALQNIGVTYVDKEDVHPMTLRAFVKEQIESGNADFPLDTFKVFIGKKCTIKTK